METSNRPSAVSRPQEACYGFPPPPSVLRQISTAKPTEALNCPLPSSSTISPPTTPTAPHNHTFIGDESHRVEYGSNLAEYLAKNPGMKRLYNNHGCINRPACVSCHESRKKCDLERPCARCVKQKLPCIERPPRAKRRKVEEQEISKPKPKSKAHPQPPPANYVPYGLPSPVSEPHSWTRVGTPMELTPTPVSSIVYEHSQGVSCCTTPTPEMPSPGGLSETVLTSDNANFSLDISTCIATESSDTALLLEPSLDILEVPAPDSYLEGVSSTCSAAPIFGLESIESSVREEILAELERDLQQNDGNFHGQGLGNLSGAGGENTDGTGQLKINFEDMDIDSFMSCLPTEQELKDLLAENNLDLEFPDLQADPLSGFSTITEADSSPTVGSLSWDDAWNIS